MSQTQSTKEVKKEFLLRRGKFHGNNGEVKRKGQIVRLNAAQAEAFGDQVESVANLKKQQEALEAEIKTARESENKTTENQTTTTTGDK